MWLPYRSKISMYLSFCAQLILLKVTSSSSNHNTNNGRISFFFLSLSYCV